MFGPKPYDRARVLADAEADRPMVVRLLQRAVELDPDHLPATLDLARALSATGAKAQGVALLEGFLPRAPVPLRRRVLWAKTKIAPSPRALCAWIRG